MDDETQLISYDSFYHFGLNSSLFHQTFMRQSSPKFNLKQKIHTDLSHVILRTLAQFKSAVLSNEVQHLRSSVFEGLAFVCFSAVPLL